MSLIGKYTLPPTAKRDDSLEAPLDFLPARKFGESTRFLFLTGPVSHESILGLKKLIQMLFERYVIEETTFEDFNLSESDFPKGRKTIIIFPGGMSCENWHLSVEQMDSIRRFTRRNLVKLVGICAGAYFLSQSSVYTSKEKSRIIKSERELAMFKGACIGPAFKDNEAFSGKVNIKLVPISCRVSCLDEGYITERAVVESIIMNGGGYFLPRSRLLEKATAASPEGEGTRGEEAGLEKKVEELSLRGDKKASCNPKSDGRSCLLGKKSAATTPDTVDPYEFAEDHLVIARFADLEMRREGTDIAAVACHVVGFSPKGPYEPYTPVYSTFLSSCHFEHSSDCLDTYLRSTGKIDEHGTLKASLGTHRNLQYRIALFAQGCKALGLK